MRQRLATLMACVTIVTVAVEATEQKTLPDSVRSALQFFEGHDDLSIDEFLGRGRPSPIDVIERDRVLKALPYGTIPPDAQALAKMSLGEEVLAYHGRRGVITFTIARVTPAFVGLLHRAVIVVSANVLPLLTKEQFAAVVAHEIGHEYVWADYRHAETRHDHAHIRELELRCDGIAVLTLRRLGLGTAPLIRAIERLTSYNKELGLDDNASDYLPLRERRAFIQAVEQLHWADRPTARISLVPERGNRIDAGGSAGGEPGRSGGAQQEKRRGFLSTRKTSVNLWLLERARESTEHMTRYLMSKLRCVRTTSCAAQAPADGCRQPR